MPNLRFLAISGTTDVTENFYVYEYGNDMIVVDCGVGFPESGMYGVDLIIPDFSYVKKNMNKLRGVLITHGHEDHFGALPFLVKEVKAPIYSTKLVAGFIEDKFKDYKIKGQDVKVFDPDKDVLSLGVFKVSAFRVNHSVPDAIGYSIDTPEGRCFHVPDYKFDWTPVSGKVFDVDKLAGLASENALMLASDSLGSTTPGYTESERGIQPRVEAIARDVKGRIFFTTISSNISRMQQAINVAKKEGRKVCFVGRSIDSKSSIARDLGFLFYDNGDVVNLKTAAKLRRNEIMYIISGSYGQPGSSLDRVSLGEHDMVNIEPGDVVIFSSDPAPPGSKGNVDNVVDRLIDIGVDVHYYDLQEDLHVSGHGSQEDIKMLFGIVNPKYLVPIGGTVRHMRSYKEIAEKMGHKEEEVFELKPGDVVEFQKGKARQAQSIDVRTMLVDGLGIGDVGNVVLRDRHRLAQDGVAIVLVQIDKRQGKLIENPEVISRGFVFEKKEKNFLELSADKLKAEIEKKNHIDKSTVRQVTIGFLERYFFKETGRRPMILPVIVEV